MRLPIAPEGRRFVAAPLTLALLALAVAGVAGGEFLVWCGWALLFGAAFCAFFFRDPERALRVTDRRSSRRRTAGSPRWDPREKASLEPSA